MNGVDIRRDLGDGWSGICVVVLLGLLSGVSRGFRPAVRLRCFAMDEERRQHRRLSIRLPLECCPKDGPKERTMRTVTKDIGTGGVYFEADLLEGMPAPELDSLLDIELIVPPGDGHFPYEGRVTSIAEVVRCEPLEPPPSAGAETPLRAGVAARFKEPLRLAF